MRRPFERMLQHLPSGRPGRRHVRRSRACRRWSWRSPASSRRPRAICFRPVRRSRITFVLSLFLLASGTMFYEKIVQSFARMSEKKRALRVVYDVEREISHYLLTVALINAGLGLAVGFGLWAIGMPNAAGLGRAGGASQLPALYRRGHDHRAGRAPSRSSPSTACPTRCSRLPSSSFATSSRASSLPRSWSAGGLRSTQSRSSSRSPSGHGCGASSAR